MLKYPFALIGFLLIIASTLFIFSPRRSHEAAPAEVPQSHLNTFKSDRYGFSFSYPDTYELTEHEAAGGALREQHTIVLMRKTDLPPTQNGEGPPSITIDIVQNNLDKLMTEEWIRGSSVSNFKLSPEGTLSAVSLGGLPALSYRWSGLYEGTTIAIARADWVYAFSVTYLEPGADSVQDFVALRESIAFSDSQSVNTAQ